MLIFVNVIERETLPGRSRLECEYQTMFLNRKSTSLRIYNLEKIMYGCKEWQGQGGNHIGRKWREPYWAEVEETILGGSGGNHGGNHIGRKCRKPWREPYWAEV